MSIELTEEQSKAIEQAAGAPPSVTDPRTQKTYVLITMDVFQQIKSLVGSEAEALADTYPAQLDSAMKAGWGDPAMDEYNDYDAHCRS
jgi:hypothetical protein